MCKIIGTLCCLHKRLLITNHISVQSSFGPDVPERRPEPDGISGVVPRALLHPRLNIAIPLAQSISSASPCKNLSGLWPPAFPCVASLVAAALGV